MHARGHLRRTYYFCWQNINHVFLGRILTGLLRNTGIMKHARTHRWLFVEVTEVRAGILYGLSRETRLVQGGNTTSIQWNPRKNPCSCSKLLIAYDVVNGLIKSRTVLLYFENIYFSVVISGTHWMFVDEDARKGRQPIIKLRYLSLARPSIAWTPLCLFSVIISFAVMYTLNVRTWAI